MNTGDITHTRNIDQYYWLEYLEKVQHFFFGSILIIFKFFQEGKGMEFFKIQAKNFALPFP